MTWLPALAGAIIYAAAVPSFADALDSSTLPSQARWVLHVDADGIRQAPPIANLIRQRIIEPQGADLPAKVAVLERITGMKLPQDVHDVTLFGTSFDQAGVCIRLHAANLDETGITAFLHQDTEFSQLDHNGHTVMTWCDRSANRLMFVSFVKRDVVILSSNNKTLLDALDTADAKSPELKAGSPLLPPQVAADAPHPLFWMAGESLADLPRVQNTESPLLEQMEAASFSINWSSDRAVAEVRVTAKNDKAAQQMQTIAEGAKAMVSLMAEGSHATARNKLLATMMQKFGTETDGKVLKGSWEVDVKNVELLLNTIHAEQATTAVTAPALVKPANGRP